MSSRWRTSLKLLITAVLLATVFYRIDLGSLWEVISSADPLLLMAAASVQFVNILLSAARWRVIFQRFSISESYPAAARITMMGFFFNFFLPSGIGGDVFRAYFLAKRTGGAMPTTLMTLVLDRSSGLLALLLIGVAATLAFPMQVGGLSLFWVFLGLLAAYLLAHVFLFHSATHRLLLGLMRRFKRDGLVKRTEMVAVGLRALRRSPLAILRAAGCSLLIQFFSVVVVWLAALSIDLPAGFTAFLIFIPLVNLTIMIPITINGAGLRETIYIQLFQTIGVSQEFSVSLALLQLGVFLMASLPGAILYHLYKKDEHLDEFRAES